MQDPSGQLELQNWTFTYFDSQVIHQLAGDFLLVGSRLRGAKQASYTIHISPRKSWQIYRQPTKNTGWYWYLWWYGAFSLAPQFWSTPGRELIGFLYASCPAIEKTKNGDAMPCESICLLPGLQAQPLFSAPLKLHDHLQGLRRGWQFMAFPMTFPRSSFNHILIIIIIMSLQFASISLEKPLNWHSKATLLLSPWQRPPKPRPKPLVTSNPLPSSSTTCQAHGDTNSTRGSTAASGNVSARAAAEPAPLLFHGVPGQTSTFGDLGTWKSRKTQEKNRSMIYAGFQSSGVT